jgi:2-iminobutanoate/2-iminopropanoate deaminase
LNLAFQGEDIWVATAKGLSHGIRETQKKEGKKMSSTLTAVEPVVLVKQEAVRKKAIVAPQVLNEAYVYPKPSSFSRGLRLDIKDVTILMISGTASIDENGLTVHEGDFRKQTLRTYHNITALLAAEGASWKDVVRTTCYLRDIERDYAAFNAIRTEFFKGQGLDPLPASTGIQAILCRPDLLVEMEAMAIFDADATKK